MAGNPLNPRVFSVPFANVSTLKDTLPDSGAVTPGSASYEDGFPLATMTPIAAGGTPPRGQTFNGILYDITSNAEFLQRGNIYRFDDRAAAAGGYPVGAILKPNNAADPYLYESAVANNSIDFNADATSIGVSWLRKMVWSDYSEVYTYPAKFVAIGSDGEFYICDVPNGPNTPAGFQNPVSTTGYWSTLKSYFNTDGPPVFIAPQPKLVASFTAAGTSSYTIPDFNGDGSDWLAWIWVRGGGAGGGAGNISGLPHSGRSGGAGCLVKKYIKLTPGAIFSLTVGTGGSGRAAGSGQPEPTNGGTSAFGTLITSPGATGTIGGRKTPANGEDVTAGAPGCQRIPSSWNGTFAYQAEGPYGGEAGNAGAGGNGGTFPVNGTTNADGMAGFAGTPGAIYVYAVAAS